MKAIITMETETADPQKFIDNLIEAIRKQPNWTEKNITIKKLSSDLEFVIEPQKPELPLDFTPKVDVMTTLPVKRARHAKEDAANG